MEKQRIKSKSESFRRLLVLAFLFLSSHALFGQTLTYAMIKELRIVPSADQKLYANTDIKFEVIIPYIKPANVDISIPVDQGNAAFKTLRRTEEIGTGATKIELWYNFAKKGTYQLKPLELRIRGARREIAFLPVTIGINPKDQNPQVAVIFNDGRIISNEVVPGKNPVMTVKAGEKIKFTINLQYATQLVQFDWDIPKDSIFVQGKTYEFTEVKYREKNFSDDYIPISDFEWTPLVPGEVSFPEFLLTATSYKGSKVNVRLPGFTILVEKGTIGNSKKTKNYFSQAFEEEGKDSAVNKKAVITKEQCEILAELRSGERHELFGKTRKVRIQMETELGLPSIQKEFSVIWIYISAVFVVLFAILIVIFIKRKGILLAICGVFLEICAAAVLVYFVVQANHDYGISTGSVIHSIPEANAEIQSELPAGNRVRILEKAGDWYYIQLGEAGGWCRKNDLILIK